MRKAPDLRTSLALLGQWGQGPGPSAFDAANRLGGAGDGPGFLSLNSMVSVVSETRTVTDAKRGSDKPGRDNVRLQSKHGASKAWKEAKKMTWGDQNPRSECAPRGT